MRVWTAFDEVSIACPALHESQYLRAVDYCTSAKRLNTLSDRLQIKALVKKCYDTRSTIAHGGKSAVTDHDLGQLTIIVWNVIRALIDKTYDFQNQKNLHDYLENLKFS